MTKKVSFSNNNFILTTYSKFEYDRTMEESVKLHIKIAKRIFEIKRKYNF